MRRRAATTGSPLLTTITLILCALTFAQSAAASGTRQEEVVVARNFATLVDPSFEELDERSRAFAEALSRDKSARGYVIGYNARVSRYGDWVGSTRANYAQHFLVFWPGQIERARVVVLRGGLRERNEVEMFVVPRGARPPAPTPTHPADAEVRCPLVNTGGPSHVWDTASPIKFGATVRLDRPPTKRPVFNWTVTTGRVVAGQGTPEVTVEQPGGEYRPVTASVEVAGFAPECDTRAAATSPPELMPVPYKFDEFGAIRCGDEIARLDNLALSLQSDSRMGAYLVVYGPRQKGGRNEARGRAMRMKAYLVYSRGIAPGRIVSLDAGHGSEVRGELWLVPRGGRGPVDASAVRSGVVNVPRVRGRRPSHCGDIYDRI